jgi:hypothetical protein
MKQDKKLVVFWSKRENDFLIRYPRSCDGHLAYGVFCGDRMRLATAAEQREHNLRWDFDPSFVKELEARGYDTTTLRFECKRRPQAPTPDGEEGAPTP